jgi:hypothetical protein
MIKTILTTLSQTIINSLTDPLTAYINPLTDPVTDSINPLTDYINPLTVTKC